MAGYNLGNLGRRDHRVIGASKIARDISDQKRLQDLLAAIPAAIYPTDPTGKITYYNESRR